MRSSSRGFTLIELLIVVAIIGLIAGVAIPNLLNALDKSKQKRSMSDIRAVASAIEVYAVDNAAHPTAASVATLRGMIDPVYIANVPIVDGWSHTIQVDSTADSYTVYSFGKDGVGNSCVVGATSTFNDQICFVDGRFARYPDGMQQ